MADLRIVADLLPGLRERDSRDSEAYPAENIAALLAARIPAGPFAPELGGLGWDLRTATRAAEMIASASPSTALLAVMPMGLAGVYSGGPKGVPEEHRAAWAEQVDLVASHFREGAIYAACNSEKGAGGSLAATKTIATKDAGGTFRLDGEKILASSGRHAKYFFSSGKVTQEDLPGAGVVEFFFVPTDAEGVEILQDWDGFGMRPTESQTVRYTSAPAERMLGFPNFIEVMRPLQYWYCLFAAIPLGCARSILDLLSDPEPQSPALRLRLSEAAMRYEALQAYLLETASRWRPGASAEYGARVLRTKTFVSQEATKLAAELFALSGGRSYRRGHPAALALADSFAGTALRPPLPLALETMVEQFLPGGLDSE